MVSSLPAADRPCLHENFDAQVGVARILQKEGDDSPAGFSATIRVSCTGCGERFRWIGLQAGLRSDRPMCSADEFDLIAPLRPASADPDFGLGLTGYSIWQK